MWSMFFSMSIGVHGSGVAIASSEAAGSGLVRQNDKETGSIYLTPIYLKFGLYNCGQLQVGIDPS